MKLFIQGDGKFRFWWDMMIVVLTFYTLAMRPIKIAFNPPVMNSKSF